MPQKIPGVWGLAPSQEKLPLPLLCFRPSQTPLLNSPTRKSEFPGKEGWLRHQ